MDGATVKIEVISMWYNEVFLAPFFLRHYEPADHIRIFVDSDTNDKSRSWIDRFPNASQEEFKMPQGMNTQIKQDVINQAYLESDADWVILVDADELVLWDDLRILHKTQCDVFFAMLYQVYRHETDIDLDRTSPAFYQRRHGDSNITTGLNALYKKPIIARGGKQFCWSPGCHIIRGPERVIRFGMQIVRGAHWAMADPCFCISRRMERKARRSEYDKANGMGWHLDNVTYSSLYAQCEEHRQDPRVF